MRDIADEIRADAERLSPSPGAIDSALRVMVLTRHIREYLEANDPMALLQARVALGLAEKPKCWK